MKNKKSHKKIKLKKGIVAVILTTLTILAIIIFLIPFSYQASEFYNIQEAYVEDVCESVELKSIKGTGTSEEECLNEICDSTRSICVDTNWLGNCVEYRDQCTNYACTRYMRNCNLEINNIDDTYGTWTIKAYSVNAETNEEKFIDSVRIGIQPTRTATAKWQFSYNAGENIKCKYGEIINPTKTICDEKTKFKDIQKERQIIQKDILFNMITKKTQYVFYSD